MLSLIKEKAMSELISGKEALFALANGEEVEFKCGGMSWSNLDAKQQPLEILIDKNVSLRLKSKTINLNGIEVPKPFVPKVGETYWCFSTQTVLGYGHNVYVSDYDDKRFINMGAWRSEDEIKQVISVLRTIFKTD